MNKEDRAKLFLKLWKMIGDKRYQPVGEYKFAQHIKYINSAGHKCKREYRADAAFIPQMLLVEVDGAPRMVKYDKHGIPRAVGGHDGEKDHAKENLAAALGYRVMHFSPRELETDPSGCVVLVLQALAWTPDKGDV